MLTNGSATLYNRWEESGEERCIRTILPAVFWQGAAEGGFAGRRYSKKGKESLYSVLVIVPGDRLPLERGYLPARQWLALSETEKERFFTFQIGDVLVWGDCPFEWGLQNPLRNLAGQYDGVTSLKVVRLVETPNGFSHWELEGI